MEFENCMGLLALAYVPKDGRSILDWTPFPEGDKLDEIINKHNQRCVQSLEEREWFRPWIEKWAEVIKVLPYDLSSLSQLPWDEFAGIRILLVDVDAIEKSPADIDYIKPAMAKHDHCYHLAQVSQTSNAAEPCTSYFRGLAPIIVSTPEILASQELFEDFLGDLCGGYRRVLRAMSKKLLTTDGRGFRGTVNEAYIKDLAKKATDVRDRAMLAGLSKAKTVALARRKVSLESLMVKQRPVRRGYSIRPKLGFRPKSGGKAGRGPGRSGRGPGRSGRGPGRC